MCILAILLVASASASDLNETAIQNNGDVFIEESEDNHAEISANGVDENANGSDASNIVGANHFPESSNEIQNCIDAANEGDTIIFDGTYVISNTIDVNKAVTFVGINDAVIDGNNRLGLFNISSSGVIFKDITFKNGNSTECGGAIYSSSDKYNTSVQNSRFINNFAKNYGGAIYNVNALNCSFIANSVSDNAGGAIYNGSAINCSFINNHALSAGGAIFRGSVLNSRFENNTVDKNGGALCDVDAINCSFANNYAAEDGGAIYNGNAWNCSFLNNAVRVYGGAIYGGNAWNCSFVNCSSKSSGGAIRDTNVWNCSFVGNYARSFGGAMLYGAAVNCSFVNNGAYAGGAVMYVDVVDCSFVNNTVSGYGGAMSWGSAANCTFINNTARNYGGAIYNANALNCSFIGNSVFNNAGGAIYNGSAINCSFISNHAFSAGGAIFRGSALNCRFENNAVDKNGGAVCDVDAINCSFVNNYAIMGGGALFDGDAVNCSFVNNSARTFGGAISLSGKNNVINCSFESNTANYGAAIRIEGNDLILENLTFTNNYAETYGGALDGKGSNLTVANCNFTDCYCNINEGGALSFDDFDNITIANCNFIACHSKTYGGAIRLEASNNVCMDNLSFTDCYSQRGGSLYIGENSLKAHSSNISVSNCIFTNSSSDYGGSISCMGETGNFSLFNSSFTNSSSNVHGGAVDCYKSENVNIKDCLFNNCSSVSSGAMRLCSVDGIDVEGCRFENCSSVNEGGALYCNEGDDLKIGGCSFENCSSLYGDYINFGEISNYSVVDCIFDVVPSGIDYYYDSVIDVDDLSIVLGDDAIIAVRLYTILGPLSNKILTFTIGDNAYTKVTFSDGSCIFNITEYLPGLGTYAVTIGYDGEGRNKSVSKTITVGVNSFIGNLTLETIGKYYKDTFLSFKLTDSKTGEGISRIPIRVIFSNGKEVSFSTDSNGEYLFRVPYAPGSYSLRAFVDMNNIDVNAVELNDLNIYKITGKISIEVSKASRDMKVILSNPSTGDFYRNVKVMLEFSNGAYAEVITGSDGVATYRIPFDIGHYSVLAYVSGDYVEIPVTEFSGIEINEESDPVNLNPSKISFANNIVFDYLKSGSTTFATVGCSISSANISVVGHPEIRPQLSGNRIIVSGLDVGRYVMRVVTTPDEGYYSYIGSVNIIVNTVSAVVKASKLTVVLNKGTFWTVKITDYTTGKPISGLKLTIMVFTASKFKTVILTTDSKGEVHYQTKGLSKGTHKVVVSSNQKGYKFSNFVSSIKVIKPKALKFKVKKKIAKDGSSLSITVKYKNKPINGIKIKVKVYNGKKLVKTVTLKTKIKGKYKGVAGWGTNKLKAGSHKVVIVPASITYSGSKSLKMKIKKSAKKYPKWETKI